MTQDKRKVSTDALETLGMIIGDTEKRDAIYLAVEPVVAQEKLYPGQDVGPNGTKENPVGIVDPFLKEPVQPGQRFWLVIYPRQIHSLRHVWTHPSFPDESNDFIKENHKRQIKFSKEWMEDFWNKCKEIEENSTWSGRDYDIIEGLQYEDLINAASKFLKKDIFFYVSKNLTEKFYYEEFPKAFWDYYEILTGEKVPEDKKTNFFTCLC